MKWENDRTESAKTAKNRRVLGRNYPFACSAGFRQVPGGSARFRLFPQWSIALKCLSPRSYIPPTDHYRAFRNHQDVGRWGRGRRRKREARN